jgi:hypothetical protein
VISSQPPFPPPLSREESAEFTRKRRGRNVAMLVVLVAVAALFYAIAVVKLAHPLAGAH